MTIEYQQMPERQKVFNIMCRTKRGQGITSEELKLCERMLRDFPDDYGKMEEEVFLETRPFGAEYY